MEYLLGVLVSLIVEGIKRWFGTDTFMTHVVLFVTALLGALMYVWLSADAVLWQSILQVLVVASAFHNLILRKFEGQIAQM